MRTIYEEAEDALRRAAITADALAAAYRGEADAIRAGDADAAAAFRGAQASSLTRLDHRIAAVRAIRDMAARKGAEVGT